MKNNFGLGNIITEYKNRNIDMSKPVWIYRNLHQKHWMYSIKQNDLVVGHTNCIMLNNAEFIVWKSGQSKVRKTKQKNVHAFVRGIISKHGGLGTTAKECEDNGKALPTKITYNPYIHNEFIYKNFNRNFIVKKALFVVLNKNGVSGAFLN